MYYKKIKKIIENNITHPDGMVNIDNVFEFLSGNNFSDMLSINISDSNYKKTREERILNEIKNKKVLHIGFVDHLPLVDERMKSGKWFHDFLVKNSQKCIGIDINEEGVNYIKDKYKYGDIYKCDITNPNLNFLKEEKFDVMFLGEIIEHVNDPIPFLTKINNLYKENINTIILTTPNSLSYNNFYTGKRGYETINSDHKTLFSYYTLLKALHISGFKTKEISFTDPTYKLWHKILNKIIRKEVFRNKPQFSSTLVSVSSFK